MRIFFFVGVPLILIVCLILALKAPAVKHIRTAAPTPESIETLKDFDREVSKVISSYFSGFNEFEKYSKVSSPNFIEKVYLRCFGEEGKSLKEMRAALKNQEEEGELLLLVAYRIEMLKQINDSEVHLTVKRDWENDDRDEATYIIRKINNQWKFDDFLENP